MTYDIVKCKCTIIMQITTLLFKIRGKSLQEVSLAIQMPFQSLV